MPKMPKVPKIKDANHLIKKNLKPSFFLDRKQLTRMLLHNAVEF